ncbi:MAG: hypothetical protein ABS38_06895 [Acidovorax sp. SCN 68-22]|nr:MAG: hypothetical protein ABS38_06895 [Acidovorax sp. SCN 68-22]
MGIYDYKLPFQQRLLDEVDMALEEIRAGGNSHGILLMGASGTGKSHALDLVVGRFGAESQEGYQRIKTCCRVSSAAKADAPSIAAGVLAQLGKPVSTSSGTTKLSELELSMHAAMRAHKVLILILEEFHNALLSNSPLFRGQTARMLKNIWNQAPLESAGGWAIPDTHRGDYRLLIIVSGTDELRKPFDTDKELGSRFSCVIETEQPRFFPPESLREFRLVLQSLAERYGLADHLDANNDDVASRLLIACGAHYRKLEKLLQRIATLSRRHPEQNLSLEMLATAYDQVGDNGHLIGNPFRWSSEEVTAYVKRAMAMPKITAHTTNEKPKGSRKKKG